MVEPSPSLVSSPAVLFFVALALGFVFVSATVTGWEAIRPERLGGSAAALSSAVFLGGIVEVEIQGDTRPAFECKVAERCTDKSP